MAEAQGDEAIITDLTPPGYNLHHHSRPGRGGGIAVIYRQYLQITFKQVITIGSISFESLEFQITHGKTCTNILALYRPPPSKKNSFTFSMFHDEFAKILDSVVCKKSRLVIIGDFNIHFDKKDNLQTAQMLKLLDSHNCKQLVSEPTHKSGHIVDWVLSRDGDSCTTDVRVTDLQVSDHHLLTIGLDTTRPLHPTKSIRCRNISKIYQESFRSDLEKSRLLSETPTECADIVDLYNTFLLELLDKHAPEKVRKIPYRPETAWIFTPAISDAKAERRAAERLRRKTRLEVYRQMYCVLQNKVSIAIRRSKTEFMNSKIRDSRSNPNALYKLMFTLMGRNNTSTLPNIGDSEYIAQQFSDFFIEKIVKIHQTFPHDESPSSMYKETHFSFESDCLTEFAPFTTKELLALIKKSKPTSCALDPIPTKIVVSNIDILIPVILHTVNSSLRSGVVPHSIKKAIVKPLLNKTTLDKDESQSYRPVSNLSFISKAVGKRLAEHLEHQNLYEPFQSAYRPKHSTETALLKVLNDLRRGIDSGNVGLLVLLELIP
ncbi:uncharacterized protein LOC124287149 [Haliotis rubra]|uniref:uncharacterized protein LOC124287149 n=1 Tax=Haliotis rubra TaxID=36100 RepID=UPI001EE51908|nr:uncharacterized protein LOC124287149 [Haliotis rubra]